MWESKHDCIGVCLPFCKIMGNVRKLIVKHLICVLHFLLSIYKKGYGQKLRRIILLHLGQVTFRFLYRGSLKTIIFTIWGFSNVSMAPKTNYFHLWRRQDTSNNSRKIKTKQIRLVLQISNFGNRKLRTCWKRRLKDSSNSYNGINIFQKNMKLMF